jgi:hypothetical protein
MPYQIMRKCYFKGKKPKAALTGDRGITEAARPAATEFRFLTVLRLGNLSRQSFSLQPF